MRHSGVPEVSDREPVRQVSSWTLRPWKPKTDVSGIYKDPHSHATPISETPIPSGKIMGSLWFFQPGGRYKFHGMTLGEPKITII